MPKNLIFNIPGDLHLIGKLRLTRANDFKAYFNEAESLSKSILESDTLNMQRNRQPISPEALERMKRIAYVIQGICNMGRKALNKKDKTEREAYAYKILHLKAEIFAEPDRYRGENLARNQSKGGKAKTALSKGKHATWQHRADEIWRKRPDVKIHDAARSIARQTGDKSDTIRKVIKKNKKTAEV